MAMLALCHVPKTGGTTLVDILRRSYGLHHCDVRPLVPGRYYGSADHRFAARLHPGLASVAGHMVSPSSDLEAACGEVLYYAVLREPFKRLASAYQHVDRHGTPPATFVAAMKRPWWIEQQCRQIAGRADVTLALDLIARKDVLLGLTEAFDEFLVMLRMRAGDPRLDIRYERRNVAPDNTLARSLLEDADVRSSIEEANPADMELWRRVRDELYPAQRERFPGLERELKRFREEPPLPRWSARLTANRIHRNLVYKPAVAVARHLRRAG